MLSSKRHIMADEELGKKDDDHKRRSDRDHRWHSKSQWRLPRRRSVLVLVTLYLIYLFFKHMPTDLPPVRERPAFAASQQKPPEQWSRPPPSPEVPDQKPPPRYEPATENKEGYYYEGEVKFYGLAPSLKLFQKTGIQRGTRPSHAVVFAGASLESISDLLPLACRMANHKTNEVHFVLMGRDDVSIEGLQRVNSISNENCPVNWHDARPDYAQWSTEARMERAVTVGLKYVYAYLRPQVIITQGESSEEPFCLRGSRRTSEEFGVPHIALPRAARDLMWMSTLDSHALRVWNDIHIELLVNAQPESSGSLLRLIRSLQEADYLGSIPSLTIELPADVDSQLLSFLQRLDWPSADSKLTIRRHLRPHYLNSAEAALKTVEAFYPKDPNATHVLMLSPQTELAPSFYHYLKYTMLKYKYSNRGKQLGSGLFGISLELPSTRITDETTFKPPRSADTRLSSGSAEAPPPSFLWQAPNTNAALYFGDKWVELHSFLAKRLLSWANTPEDSDKEKVVSKRYPAVMEYLLELIRAKGYYLLYPAFPASGIDALATVHNELYQYPEEYTDGNSKSADVPALPVVDPSTPLTADFDEPGVVEKLLSRASTAMPLLDQYSLELAEIDNLPVLSYRGDELSGKTFSRQTEEYAQQFRARHGGCSDEEAIGANTNDLFCVHD